MELRLVLTDVSGTISSEVYWDATSTPYNLTGTVFIASGGTLHIADGVQVTGTNRTISVQPGGKLIIGEAQIDVSVFLGTNNGYQFNPLAELASDGATFSKTVTFSIQSGGSIQGGAMTGAFVMKSNVLPSASDIDFTAATAIQVAPAFVSQLSGCEFAPNTTIDIVNGKFDNLSAVTWDLANVTTYRLVQGFTIVNSDLTLAEGTSVSAESAGIGIILASGSLHADGVVFGAGLTTYAGSVVEIINSTVTSPYLDVRDQTDFTFVGNDLSAGTTLQMAPSSVPSLAGNSLNGRSLVGIGSGTISSDTTWNVPGVTEYRVALNAEVVVQSATLTLAPGVTCSGVESPSILYTSGKMTIQNEGNLVASSVAFRIGLYFLSGSSGSVVNSSFPAGLIDLAEGATPEITGTSFLLTNQVTIPVARFSDLSDNTFASNSRLNIRGSMTQDLTLRLQNVSTFYFGTSANAESATLSNATITVPSGTIVNGRLNIDAGGVLNSTGGTYNGQLYFLAGSSGMLQNGTVNGYLEVRKGTTAVIQQMSFTVKQIPVRADAEIVPILAGNVFVAGTSISVRGSIEQDTTWNLPNVVSYLGGTSDVVVISAAALTIAPNVTTTAAFTLNAGATLTASGLRLTGGNSFTLNEGATATLTGGSSDATIILNAGANPVFSGFDFSSIRSLQVDANLLPALQGNTFDSTDTIDLLGGTIETDLTLQLSGIRSFRLVGDLTVSEAQLTLPARVILSRSGAERLIIENGGTLAGTSFVVSAPVVVGQDSPGNLDVSDSYFRSSLLLGDQSQGSVSLSYFGNLLQISGSSSVQFSSNLLNLANVEMLSGLPEATFDLSNNWWGTSELGEIAARILDHTDDSLRPTAVITPVLVTPPIDSQIFEKNELETGSIGIVGAFELSGAASRTYSIVTGNLPSQISLNSSTGALTSTSSTAIIYLNQPQYFAIIRVSDASNSATFVDVAVTVNILNKVVNPIVTTTSSTTVYTENQASIIVDSGITLKDSDGPNFNGGVLTIQLTAPANAADQLLVRSSGNLQVSGNEVRYGGQLFATYSGPTIGSDMMTFQLNQFATPSIVQNLLRAISYANTSDNPVPGNRSVQFRLLDGDGGDSGTVTKTISVTAVNDAPTDLLLTSSSIAENLASGVSVGNLAGVDPDNATNFSFSLVEGSGSDDNASFAIDGSTLKTNGVFNYEGKNSYSIRVRVTDSDGLSFDKVFTISVLNVLDPPVINNFGPTVSYTENSAPVAINVGGTVVDDDSPDFAGGRMVVSLTANAQGTDVLAIRNDGVGPEQIGVSGSSVTYGGLVIGSFTGGKNKVGLTINFNANAVPAMMSNLLRAITFSSTSDNPGNLPRTVRVIINDGDGGQSEPVTKTINVIPLNDAPAVSGFDGSVDFIGPAAVLIDADAVVSDVDSTDFNGGKLVVSLIANGQGNDVLAIRNQGVGANQIGVDGSNVLFGGTLIGTFTGGANKVGLTVTLNASATPAAVQALLRNVTFINSAATRVTDTRTARVLVLDGDGGTSAAVTKSITVAPGNTPPAVGSFDGSVNYTPGSGATVIDGDATVTDSDSADFNGGKLTVTLTANGQGTDILGIQNIGSGVGEIGVSGNQVSYSGVVIGTFTGGTNKVGLTVTFNANATPAAVQALLRNITFRSSLANPVTLARTVRVLLTDGDGGTSPAVTKQLSVG